MIHRIIHFFSTLGPGLLYAGAAVGVSHLVMSTKAGAMYQFLFLLLIPLIHVIKYPFFKYGPQYTALTGRNILHGYQALGNWALRIYIVLTLLSMCLIQAAVTLVTSAIAIHFFALQIPAEYLPHVPAIVILVIAAVILFIGQYSALDKTMKAIILVLTLTTITALLMVLFRQPADPVFQAEPAFSLYEYADIIFLAAFLGWMPAPMDISVWHSVWAEEDARSKGRRPSLPRVMRDFRIGYFGTAILAMIFLSLGAMIMFGNGETPSQSGAVFAAQLMNMYTDSLGEWAYPIIGIAALATMFSTMLTCLDAYPRTLAACYLIWRRNNAHPPVPAKRAMVPGSVVDGGTRHVYRVMLAICVIGTVTIFFVVSNTVGAMGLVVTVATVVSFLSAPVLAAINHRVMQGDTIAVADRPDALMTLWSRVGIACMVLFGLASLWLMLAG